MVAVTGKVLDLGAIEVWLLHNALWSGSVNVTLIALRDREEGDCPGGTKHMTEARGRGAQTIVLNAKEILGLSAKEPEALWARQARGYDIACIATT